MQLHGLWKVRLPITILIIRRGDDGDLIQVVLKAGEEPADLFTCRGYHHCHVLYVQSLDVYQAHVCNFSEDKQGFLACSTHWLLH